MQTVDPAGERGLRLLFLTDRYMPHSGGARVYYHNLYSRMVEQFPDQVCILTKKVPGWREFDRRYTSKSLHISRHGTPLPHWKITQYPRMVPPLVRSLAYVGLKRPDQIHFGDLFPPGLISLAFRSTFRIPYLAYCHGDENSQVDQRRYQPMVRDRIYRQASAVIAANEFARQGLLRIGVPDSRVHKITPGIDLDRFQPGPADPELVRKLGLQGKLVLLTAARLVEKKGHRTLLHALARVRSLVPPLQYLIVGDGPERSKLEALTKELDLTSCVTFAGDVPNAELPRYYRLCDVFAMINRKSSDGDIETFGMVFVEASAMGKPVVGGRSGGTAESVIDGETGLLAGPDDVPEIVSALQTLLTDSAAREKFGAAGLRYARTGFSWKDRAATLHEISRQISHPGATA